MGASSRTVSATLNQRDRSSATTTLLDDGACAIARATAACERAAGLLDATRDLIVKFGLVAALAGGNDERMSPRSYIWIAPSDGCDCDVCGRAIPAGEVEYQLVVDGRQISVDRACYRRMQRDGDQTPLGSA